MMHFLAFEAAREHYKDLLREAERERFVTAHQWSEERGGKRRFANAIATKFSGLIAWRQRSSIGSRHQDDRSGRLHSADA